MNLVNDEDSDVLDIVTGLPTSTDAVPFLWGGHYQGSLIDRSHVRSDIPRQLHDSVNRHGTGDIHGRLLKLHSELNF